MLRRERLLEIINLEEVHREKAGNSRGETRNFACSQKEGKKRRRERKKLANKHAPASIFPLLGRCATVNPWREQRFLIYRTELASNRPCAQTMNHLPADHHRLCYFFFFFFFSRKYWTRVSTDLIDGNREIFPNWIHNWISVRVKRSLSFQHGFWNSKCHVRVCTHTYILNILFIFTTGQSVLWLLVKIKTMGERMFR